MLYYTNKLHRAGVSDEGKIMEKNNQTGAPSPDEARKKLKKYARREARAMQALEQARRDLKKAEDKLAKATRNLQEQQAFLQTCEEKLEEARSARRAFQASMEAAAEAQEVAEEVVSELIAEELAEEAREEVASEIAAQELAEALVEEAVEKEVEEVLVEEVEEVLVEEVEEALNDLAETEAAVEKAVNEAASEQSSFDANETITMGELEMEEMLAREDFSQPDENATRDLVDTEAEEAAVEEVLLVDLQSAGEQSGVPEIDQEDAPKHIPVEGPKQPTRKSTPRRPRTNTSSTPRPAPTRRRTSSSRVKSNDPEKSSDEGHEER
jgi:septal ring factor EnvC (AmiA/AmiB activator)